MKIKRRPPASAGKREVAGIACRTGVFSSRKNSGRSRRARSRVMTYPLVSSGNFFRREADTRVTFRWRSHPLCASPARDKRVSGFDRDTITLSGSECVIARDADNIRSSELSRHLSHFRVIVQQRQKNLHVISAPVIAGSLRSGHGRFSTMNHGGVSASMASPARRGLPSVSVLPRAMDDWRRASLFIH